MNPRIRLLLITSVVCLAVSAADVNAQGRSRGGGGRSGGGSSVGRAVPRGSVRSARPIDGRRGVVAGPRVGSPRFRGSAGFYRPYYYGYRPGVRIGIFAGYGYPYYGYPYYGYPYYGYAYRYPYPYSYGAGYGYGGYGYGGYDYAYGAVRIQGAPRDAQVYADGYYAGIVDDFDGPFQRLELEAGAHQIEIRGPGLPPLTYDVNVQPGQTLTLHVR
jgi:PEGA domain-containing protein